MASPVKDAKAKVQAQYPGASVHSRGRNQITHKHPSEQSRYFLDVGVGGKGWHYGAGPFTEANEVDTAWQIGQGVWDYEVVNNDFHSFVNDSVPVSYRYLDVATGEEVDLTVTGIDWVNDENDSENAASFSQVTPTIEDEKIKWSDIATGWDITIQAQTVRLKKVLTIDTLANLGSPTIGGTNPRLQLNFSLSKSSGLEIWLDGNQWDEQNNTEIETSGDIELRVGGSGGTVFWFKRPSVRDQSKTQTGTITQKIKKRGNNLLVDVSIPWIWLQSASFPIEIDPTIEEDITTGSDDAFEGGNTVVDITAESYNLWQTGGKGGWRFQTIGLDGTETINAGTYLELSFTSFFDMDCDLYGEYIGDAPTFATINRNISDRTATSAAVAWVETVSGTDQSPDIDTEIDEIINHGSWTSGNDLVLMLFYKGTPDVQWITYEGDSADDAKLYIDYTAASSDLTIDIGLDEAAYQGTGVRILA